MSETYVLLENLIGGIKTPVRTFTGELAVRKYLRPRTTFHGVLWRFDKAGKPVDTAIIGDKPRIVNNGYMLYWEYAQ